MFGFDLAVAVTASTRLWPLDKLEAVTVLRSHD